MIYIHLYPKIVQLFCKHKFREIIWFHECSYNSGNAHNVCTKCGKINGHGYEVQIIDGDVPETFDWE